MIYFDNAATSRTKPDISYDAYNFYVREIGVSPGRGSYKLAIEASRMLYQSRKTVASFFNAPNQSNVIFTKNSTEAINMFLFGYLKQGDHILISPYEHNAVFRPVNKLKELGIIDYTVIPESYIYETPHMINDLITNKTKLYVSTLASNLTGQYVFSNNIARILSERNIKVFVDSSQGAGKKRINMQQDNIDYIAFTGHKDLYALPGVGGLVCKDTLQIDPLIQGGTGIYGDNYTNPNVFPETYEAGTLNMPAIWSLKNSLEYININIDSILDKEKQLTEYFINKLINIKEVVIYNQSKQRLSTFCFNIKEVPSSDVVKYLSDKDICVRGGIHCAIKAHETIGTVNTGAVRVSLNFFNDFSEIDFFVDSIKELIKCI
jgi:cysteine desulfurase family protein